MIKDIDGKHPAEEKLIEKEKELSSLKASEQLLLESIKYRDTQISSLRDAKEKHIHALNEKNSTLQSLRNELDKYFATEERMQEIIMENTRLNGKIASLESTCSDREADLDRQCSSQQSEIRSKQELINTLQSQVKAAHEMRTSVEANLKSALENRNSVRPSVSLSTANATSLINNVTEQPLDTKKVTIFHDSLCKDINDSLMGRNDVNVSKVWAPTFKEIQDKMSPSENVHTTVVQALTRDLGNGRSRNFSQKYTRLLKSAHRMLKK